MVGDLQHPPDPREVFLYEIRCSLLFSLEAVDSSGEEAAHAMFAVGVSKSLTEELGRGGASNADGRSC